jgi:Family of unknown function (DUF5681)
MTHKPKNSAGKQAGQFRKGQSGNPAGKPKGARNHATRAIEAMLGGEAEKLTRTAIDLALAGDTVALRLCFDRLIPVRRERAIEFALPPIRTPADVVTAMDALAQGVARGELYPTEANALAGLVASAARAIEVSEIADRLDRLEATVAKES